MARSRTGRDAGPDAAPTLEAERVQAHQVGSSMASQAAPSGGNGLELRVAADAAAVRLLLAQARHEEAAETAAALFTVCIRAGYQAGPTCRL